MNLKVNEKSVNAEKFYEELEEIMITLYERWQDEKQYEDIQDYKKPLKVTAKKYNVEILKMTKKPFGCIFTVDKRTYVLKCTSKHYKYYRVK